uniref:Uncharacterized protein n=1 Tax=Vespula pensylvanica TaxID=30213 RepID=A0A834U8B7_VESPE|nr:hypothetical protein H0235_009504 [Vespula pensylvanica]
MEEVEEGEEVKEEKEEEEEEEELVVVIMEVEMEKEEEEVESLVRTDTLLESGRTLDEGEDDETSIGSSATPTTKNKTACLGCPLREDKKIKTSFIVVPRKRRFLYGAIVRICISILKEKVPKDHSTTTPL